MINSIVIKEFLSVTDRINIVYCSGDNDEFDIFVSKIFPVTHVLSFDSTFYGINTPNIIIVNNTDTSSLQKSVELCKFFHIPLLLVFDSGENYKAPDIDINFKPYNTISLSNISHKILSKKFNTVMRFDAYDKKSLKEWQSYIIEVCKQPFILTNNNYE